MQDSESSILACVHFFDISVCGETGIALGSGQRGCRFKSYHIDFRQLAQLAGRDAVNINVLGSIPRLSVLEGCPSLVYGNSLENYRS